MSVLKNAIRIMKSVWVWKIIKLLFSMIKKFFYDVPHFWLKIAYYNFRWEFANSNLLPWNLSKSIKEKNRQLNINFLTNRYSSFIEEYKHKKILVWENCKKVWVLWWQWIDQAPDLVKICVNSIKEHNCWYEVVLLNKDNYQDYLKLPSSILKKVKEWKITITHLSDIIRMALLKEYWGVWCDTTMFINSDVFKKFDDKELVIFASYFQWGKSNIFFNFCYDFFVQYHKDYSYLINYYLIDYVIGIYNKFYKIKERPIVNEEVYILTRKFNDAYDKWSWDKLFETPFFKLTWKLKFNEKINGKKTNYGHFLEIFSK